MATDWNRIYKFAPIDSLQRCPGACGNPIANWSLGYGEHRMVVKPKDEETPGDYVWDKCAMKVCPCTQRYYIREKDDAGLVGYSFECRVCEMCIPTVTRDGLCSTCVLERSGVSAKSLYSSLGGQVTPIGASRSDFLDGLLKGVILGVPGLDLSGPRGSVTAAQEAQVKLLRRCTFFPGTFDKSFVRGLTEKPSYSELSKKQAACLERLVFRYRRQIGKLGRMELDANAESYSQSDHCGFPDVAH